MKWRFRNAWSAALSFTLLFSHFALSQNDERPNVVLILADDLGFTDIAPFGSEIDTPNIARLAASGLSFTNYHTAANCAPARAMLLTGVDSHRNGVPNIPESIPPEQLAYDHYQGVLSQNVVTLASLLWDSGYHTYMTGKWHLGHTPELLPSARGFERTIAMADTGADNWEQRTYLPIYDEAHWYADGKKHTLPDDFYSSEYFIDKTIEFIHANESDDKPFFAYIPFQAVHMPVQAPREFSDKYAGVYDEGWTVMRERRRLAAEEVGVIPKNTEAIVTPGTLDWNVLTDEQRAHHARRMEVYAGMVDAMDMHIGRLMAYLESIGEYENTIFIFTSDNGAEGSPLINSTANSVLDPWFERVGYETGIENLGEKGSWVGIGPSNATVAASPLAYYKFHANEGGLRVPLVMSGPGVSQRGELSDEFVFVTDLAPTILSLVEVNDHGGSWLTREVEPIVGKDFSTYLQDQAGPIHTASEPIGYEMGGSGALFKGDYKIVINRFEQNESEWHLFNIKTDPGEANDLAQVEPELLAEMLADYNEWASNNNVLPMPEGYNRGRTILPGFRR
ncbi:MAG: arylsulfatase [Gammaproteobacteria bacterium TMED107]|nr:arylsulfatase [Gammaproteobacteria bacterium]OUX77807.1 MAG: arylsulfatase [Gammaproteobacteria bacterium TMED107]